MATMIGRGRRRSALNYLKLNWTDIFKPFHLFSLSHGATNRTSIVQLVDTMKQYLGYLKKHNEVMKVVHSSRSVIRPVEVHETRTPVHVISV